MKKKRNKKTPAFIPFVDSDNAISIGEPDFMCVRSEDNVSINTLSLEELIALRNELSESISDYDVIIDIELASSNTDVDLLRIDRKRKQKLIIEFRAVKKRIEEIKKEGSIAS